MTTAVLGRWGNANALRIPMPFCRQLGIDAGSEVDITVEGDRMVIRPAASGTLRERMAAWDGNRYLGEEIEWGGPVGSEMW